MARAQGGPRSKGQWVYTPETHGCDHNVSGRKRASRSLRAAAWRQRNHQEKIRRRYPLWKVEKSHNKYKNKTDSETQKKRNTHFKLWKTQTSVSETLPGRSEFEIFEDFETLEIQYSMTKTFKHKNGRSFQNTEQLKVSNSKLGKINLHNCNFSKIKYTQEQWCKNSNKQN